jgi:hypothetical protein
MRHVMTQIFLIGLRNIMHLVGRRCFLPLEGFPSFPIRSLRDVYSGASTRSTRAPSTSQEKQYGRIEITKSSHNTRMCKILRAYSFHTLSNISPEHSALTRASLLGARFVNASYKSSAHWVTDFVRLRQCYWSICLSVHLRALESQIYKRVRTGTRIYFFVPPYTLL